MSSGTALRNDRRPLVAVAAAISLTVAGVSLSGCTSAEEAQDVPDISGIHLETIQQVRSWDHTSEFVLAILEDYWVTSAELSEAQGRFADCLKEGYPDLSIEFVEGGGHIMFPADPFNESTGTHDWETPRWDEFHRGCTDRYLDMIPHLYYDMRSNPEGLTFDEEFLNCLNRWGIEAGQETRDSIQNDGLFEIIDTLLEVHPEVGPCWEDRFSERTVVAPSGATTHSSKQIINGFQEFCFWNPLVLPRGSSAHSPGGVPLRSLSRLALGQDDRERGGH